MKNKLHFIFNMKHQEARRKFKKQFTFLAGGGIWNEGKNSQVCTFLRCVHIRVLQIFVAMGPGPDTRVSYFNTYAERCSSEFPHKMQYLSAQTARAAVQQCVLCMFDVPSCILASHVKGFQRAGLVKILFEASDSQMYALQR